jgi:hypothetical protein
VSEPRALKLSTGFEVPLDGDLLAVIEALYKEITLGEALNSSFETMRAEVVSLIDQMTDAERRNYLAESLFLNSVTYENEMLAAYVRKLGAVTPATPVRGVAAAKAAPKRRALPSRRPRRRAAKAGSKARKSSRPASRTAPVSKKR